MAEADNQRVTSDVDSGGGDISSAASHESSDAGLRSGSAGGEVCSTDISGTPPGASFFSDGDGLSAHVGDTRRKRRRAGVQGLDPTGDQTRGAPVAPAGQRRRRLEAPDGALLDTGTDGCRGSAALLHVVPLRMPE